MWGLPSKYSLFIVNSKVYGNLVQQDLSRDMLWERSSDIKTLQVSTLNETEKESKKDIKTNWWLSSPQLECCLELHEVSLRIVQSAVSEPDEPSCQFRPPGHKVTLEKQNVHCTSIHTNKHMRKSGSRSFSNSYPKAWPKCKHLCMCVCHQQKGLWDIPDAEVVC